MIRLTVQVRKDPTMPGHLLAHVVELDISTTLLENENHIPVLEDLVSCHINAMRELGKLDEVFSRLADHVPLQAQVPGSLVAKFVLEREGHISL